MSDTYDITSLVDYEQERRDKILAETKAEAIDCDCWRDNGPICARCKLALRQKEIDGRCADC